jgi:urea transport system ATP-binding protein
VGRSFVILDRGRAIASGPIGELSDDLVRRHLTV